MVNTKYTALLDERPDIECEGSVVEGSRLLGQIIHRWQLNQAADSVEAVLANEGIHVPPWAIMRGRSLAGKEDGIWSEWLLSRAEIDTLYDAKGILGIKGKVWTGDLHNCGFFVWNPARIREDEMTGQYGDPLAQDEVDTMLDAVKRQDYTTLTELLHCGSLAFAGDYQGFLEESNRDNFLVKMDTSYVVLRPVEEARKSPTGKRTNAELRSNADLIIGSGGVLPLEKMLNHAGNPKEQNGLGFRKLGIYHGNYRRENVGHIITFPGRGWYGLREGAYKLQPYLGRPGCALRAEPETIKRFYD